MTPTWLCLLLAALATWRVTHFLVAEDGPFALMARLRQAVAKLTGLFDCFYCVSLWTAAPPAVLIARGVLEAILIWLALSGAAILLERATGGLKEPPPALWREDGES